MKAINAKGFAGITIGQADELTGIAKLYGAKGLAFIKIENGEWKSPIVKFFSEAEKAALQSKLKIEEGDCIFFGADKWEIACEVLGRLRLRIAEIQDLLVAHDRRSAGMGFPLGHRLSALPMEPGRKQMERHASSLYAAENGGHASI